MSTRDDEYSLVNIDALRERRRSARQSSPDSDPSALKKEVLDYRFDAVHKRIDHANARADVIEEKLDTIAEKQAETTLTVAQGTATMKAYGAALALFITLITVAANVLPRLMK